MKVEWGFVVHKTFLELQFYSVAAFSQATEVDGGF